MKKNIFARSFTALLIITAMLLSLLLCACDTEDEDNDDGKTPSNGDSECTEHVDADEDGKCDDCEAEITSDDTSDNENNEDNKNPGNTDDTDNGLILSKAVIAQLEAAQSMKIDIVLKAVNNEEYWYLDYWNNDEYTDNPTAVKDNYYFDTIGKFTITISKTADGGINSKMDGEIKERSAADEEYETESHTYLYLVDGVIYSYDSYYDIYEKEDLFSSDELEEIENAIAELTKGIEITENDKNTILSTLGDFVITAFSIKDNKGSVSLDVKPVIDNFIKYINDLDMENDSVASVINDALALVDEELTVNAILTELERIAGLTVDQAVAELNTWLTENYETTLQGIYDTVVNDQRFADLVTEIIKSEGELDEEDINEMLTEIKSFKIADFISENNLGNVVIYDLITQLMSDGDSEDIPTSGALFGAIKDLFAMKLGEFEEETGSAIFTVLKEMVSNITVNELNAKLDINFKGVFNIDTIEAILNYDVITKSPSYEVEDKYDVNDIDLELTVKIYDISKDSIAISVPTDADIILGGILDEFFDSESDDYGEIFVNASYDGTFNISIDCYKQGIYIEASEIDVALLKSNTITIDSELLEFYSYDDGDILDHDKTTDLVIVFDLENQSYEITQIPEHSAE